MQAQPVIPVVAPAPPPTKFVPSVADVRKVTDEVPPGLGISAELYNTVTPGKRQLLIVIRWIISRFGKNCSAVNQCYQILPYIREPPSHPALPAGWTAALDELGRRYYVNQVSGESQWCRPKEAVPGYVALAAPASSTDFPSGIPFTPRGFPNRMVSNEVPAEAMAQPDVPRLKEEDPEWRPRWPTTMPDTSTPRRSARIRTMSERSTIGAAEQLSQEAEAALAETETTPSRRRSTRQRAATAAPVRRSTRLASRA